MELVNRETNFTKVFAGGKQGPQQPQVGFINPLAKVIHVLRCKNIGVHVAGTGPNIYQ